MHFTELIKTIKERREALQVTQFESGKGNPTLLTLQKISEVLGMELCLKIKNISPTK